METVEVKIVPEKEIKDKQYIEMIKKIGEEENKKIAFRFRTEVKKVTINLHFDKNLMLFKIKESSDKLGVYGGYSEDDGEIHLIYPEHILFIYRDKLEEEFRKVVRYALIKYYAYEKFVKGDKEKMSKLREIIEGLARITSENYRVDAMKFEIKNINSSKTYNKELKAMLFFYSMLVLSGIKFIYVNLGKIMYYGDVEIASQKIYKKRFFELLLLTKNKLEKIERETINTFKVRNK